jgi:hypothetical protein
MKLWPRAKPEPVDETLITEPTAEDREYARRVIERIEAGLDSSSVRRPWTDAPTRSAAEVADSCGVESLYQAPLVLALPPFHMPPRGICCAGCPGFQDKRCCARGS